MAGLYAVATTRRDVEGLDPAPRQLFAEETLHLSAYFARFFWPAAEDTPAASEPQAAGQPPKSPRVRDELRAASEAIARLLAVLEVEAHATGDPDEMAISFTKRAARALHVVSLRGAAEALDQKDGA